MPRAYKQRKHRIYVCNRCGFGVTGNYWRKHYCECRKIPLDARCKSCWDTLPCRKKGCPLADTEFVEEIEDETPGLAPRQGVVRSLGLKVRRLKDGRWWLDADWLYDAIVRDTWHEAYWAAVNAKAED